MKLISKTKVNERLVITIGPKKKKNVVNAVVIARDRAGSKKKCCYVIYLIFIKTKKNARTMMRNSIEPLFFDTIIIYYD